MKQLIPWITLVFMLPSLAASGVQAWLDRTTVALGDTVTLTIEASEDSQGEPDLKPLAENFRVLGTSNSTYVAITNGHQTAKTQWVIELEPKHSGRTQVPPLTVGNGQTQPLTVLVEAQAVGGTDPAKQALFLEAHVDSPRPYVQSQVGFTVRLLYSQPVLEGSLDVPDVPDAIIERLGEDVAYSTTRYGKRYGVIERRYALFAQRSGSLTIPPIAFEGRVRFDSDWRSRFGLGLKPGRRVRLMSESVTLQVRPRPTNYTGKHWLPSPQLTLRENWPEEPLRLKVGEPLTRTLIVEAKGLTASQLPVLPMPELPEIRLYPDQPKTETRKDGDWLIGRREQRVAMVPSESGQLVLPEMTLTWWDTQANQERTARLPARTITVLPTVETTLPPVSPAIRREQADAVEQQDKLRPPTLQDVFWPGVSTVLFGLWLLTLLLWWRSNRRPWTAPQRDSERESLPVREAKRALQRACYQGDPQAAAKSLLQWAKNVWSHAPPKNLGDLANRLATDPMPVRNLDQALYASSADSWHGSELWISVKKGLKEKEVSAKQSPMDLPPLYPN